MPSACRAYNSIPFSRRRPVCWLTRCAGRQIVALKREIELKLEDAGLIAFFENHRADWETVAQKMYDLVETLYPEGTKIRPDDVAEYLLPALKVDDGLR